MPTIRGFVEALEIGRAGLASVFLLHADGSRATYTIADLDADPERFNERLSALGLLRDAMDRAEPVELEFEGRDGSGGSIIRVRRLTRDMLERPKETQRASGQVIGLAIGIEAHPELPEPSDWAVLALMVDGNAERFIVPVQTPERTTSRSMIDLAQAAQQSGSALTVDYEPKRRLIVAMEIGAGGGRGAGGRELEEFDAFVERIAHAPDLGMMVVAVTTAPPFGPGEGNVVPLAPFTPAAVQLLVLRGSPEYALFEAALRDLLRVRVRAFGPPDRPDDNDGDGTGATIAAGKVVHAGAGQMQPLLVQSAEVLAALCSAARPVWIQVNRRSLDVGPDAECLEGVPTSDLSPRTMRDMHLPYRAEWRGIACCNHGVYRFQFELDVPFTVTVDDEELCLHADPDGEHLFAHACLHGEHQVCVTLDDWTCDQKFVMDVYRIR